MIPSTPAMPFATAADKYSTPADLSPPMPAGGMAPPPPAALAAGAPPPPAAMPMGSTLPAMPAPSAPAGPPWSVALQPDGSSKYFIPSPDGDPAKEIVLGVNPPPKLPKALAPAAPKA